MTPEIRQIIEKLHQAPCQYVLALTGGGAQTVGFLLSVPGGSRTILEVIVPYDNDSMVRFLGRAPDQNCSVEASLLLAEKAQERARSLAPGKSVLGLGCTASLASDRPKRGEHRFHFTIKQDHATTWSLTLSKGARSREEEEEILVRMLLNALAESLNVEPLLQVDLLPDEEITTTQTTFGDPFAQFFSGQTDLVLLEPDGRACSDAPPPKLLMPGSYNPLHNGHRRLAEVASRSEAVPIAFEISVNNADKGEIPAEEIRCRVAQFAWEHAVWLTREPTFVGKAQHFPGTTFVIGVDTVVRLVMPRYYNDSEEEMLKALDGLRERGCHFLVAGRCNEESDFLTLESVNVPSTYLDLFREIPEEEFREDVSSSVLRRDGEAR